MECASSSIAAGSRHLVGSLDRSLFRENLDTAHLKPIEKIWNHVEEQQEDTFRRLVGHLCTPAVDTLALLLLGQQPRYLHIIVEDAIISLILQDVHCLESLLNSSDDRLVARLIPVLSRLGEDRSMKYLMTLTRHSSASVRRTAVRTIAQGNTLQAAQVSDLIDDPDAEIRRIVLKHLSRSRDRAAEDLLTAYLQKSKFTSALDGHVMECFKALGKCGSSRCVPFLRETLMHRKWMAGFRKSSDQQGAAIALAALQIPESRQVLEEAGRSIHPGLRSLVREAEQEFSRQSKEGK